MHPPHIPCYLIQWRNSPKGALLRWKGPRTPPQCWSLQEHAMTTNRARSTQGYKQVRTMSQQVSARSQASWQESSPPPSPHTTRPTPHPPHPKVTSRSVQGHKSQCKVTNILTTGYHWSQVHHPLLTLPVLPHPKVTSRSTQGHNRSVQGHKHFNNRYHWKEVHHSLLIQPPPHPHFTFSVS